MRYVSYFKVLAYLLIIFLLTGCFGVKPASTKSGKKFFETYYVGESGTQYYIKPLNFEGNESEAALDITFRYKDVVKDSAIVNVSFIADEVFKTVDSIVVNNLTSRIKLDVKNHLFSERVKTQYLSRFTTKAPLVQVRNLFLDNGWTVTLYRPGKANIYEASSKAKKIISKLDHEVFMLF